MSWAQNFKCFSVRRYLPLNPWIFFRVKYSQDFSTQILTVWPKARRRKKKNPLVYTHIREAIAKQETAGLLNIEGGAKYFWGFFFFFFFCLKFKKKIPRVAPKIYRNFWRILSRPAKLGKTRDLGKQHWLLLEKSKTALKGHSSLRKWASLWVTFSDREVRSRHGGKGSRGNLDLQ